MKIVTSLIAIAIGFQSTTAFVPSTTAIQNQCLSTTTTARPMGIFDYFSDDARKKREEEKERIYAEQEALQREIIARRSNPEKMEEYEAKVRVRRALRMSGEDDAAENMDMYNGDNDPSQI